MMKLTIDFDLNEVEKPKPSVFDALQELGLLKKPPPRPLPLQEFIPLQEFWVAPDNPPKVASEGNTLHDLREKLISQKDGSVQKGDSVHLPEERVDIASELFPKLLEIPKMHISNVTFLKDIIEDKEGPLVKIVEHYFSKDLPNEDAVTKPFNLERWLAYGRKNDRHGDLAALLLKLFDDLTKKNYTYTSTIVSVIMSLIYHKAKAEIVGIDQLISMLVSFLKKLFPQAFGISLEFPSSAMPLLWFKENGFRTAIKNKKILIIGSSLHGKTGIFGKWHGTSATVDLEDGRPRSIRVETLVKVFA